MRAQDKQAEKHRLKQAAHEGVPWKKWGPYLSERQWGGVRENVDRNTEAWDDVTHDQSRSRAYISGEDGIAGWCDEKMLLCFALGLWNGKDPILKERMFGLTNSQGNHGEDVKEYYFYVDSTPTHAYASMVYKYPQAAYPYEDLVAENRRRSRTDFEYELMDTGVFDEDRYWDVKVEFSKIDPEDTLIRITATNHGPEAATLHLVPQLWFRNTWFADADAPRPELTAGHHPHCAVVAGRHEKLGERFLYCEGSGELLFTDNETNRYRLWGQSNPTEFQKDGINDHIITGRGNAVNPARKGTKSAFHSRITVAPGQSASLRLRLSARPPQDLADPFGDFDQTFVDRKGEADEFYRNLIPSSLSADATSVVRQGYAGLLWTKQAYVYDVEQWLNARGIQRDSGQPTRNQHWFHLYSADVISMPDKWEYPWFAAWDLAFHAEGPLPAPERLAAGVRVELRRREPARARVGGAVQLPPEPRQPGRRGAAVPQAHVPHAGRELHLVDQPQGPRRPQPVRGRLPGPRQHRRLRPQRGTTDRRLSGTGRRDVVDGFLRTVHARHGAGAGRHRPHVRGAGDQVL
jgi:hypothetical protein